MLQKRRCPIVRKNVFWFLNFVQTSPHPFVDCSGGEDGEANVHLIVETVLHHLNHDNILSFQYLS